MIYMHHLSVLAQFESWGDHATVYLVHLSCWVLAGSISGCIYAHASDCFRPLSRASCQGETPFQASGMNRGTDGINDTIDTIDPASAVRCSILKVLCWEILWLKLTSSNMNQKSNQKLRCGLRHLKFFGRLSWNRIELWAEVVPCFSVVLILDSLQGVHVKFLATGPQGCHCPPSPTPQPAMHDLYQHSANGHDHPT